MPKSGIFREIHKILSDRHAQNMAKDFYHRETWKTPYAGKCKECHEQLKKAVKHLVLEHA